MLYALLILAALIIGLMLYTHFGLGGENLSKYDRDIQPDNLVKPDGPQMKRLNDHLIESFRMPAQAANASSGWAAKRERFDAAGTARDFDCEFRGDTIEVDGRTITGDWTLVKGGDPDKRILYLHGGAFSVGSAISHRPLTYHLARLTGCAVFAPNYRLMPEHTRKATIDDSRAAYDWILENGPDGPAKAEAVGVSGDSAGGNLSLMVSHWARDTKRRAPDAVVALSPGTDSTLGSPSMTTNLDNDIMLEPLIRPILKAPRFLLLWGMKKAYGYSPSSPDVSPIFANLANLPPTLIQASADEMLYNDSTRYAAKAQAAGSPVTLETWSAKPHDSLPHVWQIFDDYLKESHDALDKIGVFFKTHGVGK